MTGNFRTLGSTCNASAKAARKTSRRRRPLRRGVVIYYMAGAMVALCGFCSLAVDLGRVQLVKTELRRSADAAARAAAGVLPDYTTGTSLAIQYAQANKADNQPVDLDSAADIEFGTWNSTS